MFTDNELKIKLYIYPIFMFALGTLGFLNEGWEWFGVLLYGLGFVVSLHIILVSVIREGRSHIDAEASRLEEQRKLYDVHMNPSRGSLPAGSSIPNSTNALCAASHSSRLNSLPSPAHFRTVNPSPLIAACATTFSL